MSPLQPTATPRAILVAGLALLSASAACQRDEIAHFRVPKPRPQVTSAASTNAAPPMNAGGADPAAGVAPAGVPPGPVLAWTLPKGWSESRAGGMRYATLKPSTSGRIEVTVIVLPGAAGGELANVNRWRGQIGLAPVEEAALGSARKRVATKAGPVSLYDFESDGQAKSRLVAALATSQGNSWFVKMVGDAAAVAAARPEFVRLVESLRFEANP